MKTKQVKKNEKNLFWGYYKDLQKEPKKANEFLNEIKEKHNISKELFYFHCKMKIVNMDFKYILLYGKLFNITLNTIQKWTEKYLLENSKMKIK